MSLSKCENCGAVLTVGADGRTSACTFCRAGSSSGAIDPAALAATLGREMNDMHAFAEHLAKTLESAFPEHVLVERSGIFSKHVTKLEVTLKQMVYRLELEGKAVTAHRTRAVHGISLKSDAIPVAEWIQELSHALSEMAAESQSAHRALANAMR